VENQILHNTPAPIRGQRQKMVRRNELILKHPYKMISHTVERIR